MLRDTLNFNLFSTPVTLNLFQGLGSIKMQKPVRHDVILNSIFPII